MYEITNASITPENFFAGNFPVVTDFGPVKSGVTIRKYAPVVKTADGVAEAETATIADLAGIAADDAADVGEAVYYLTGEFFAESLVMPAGLTFDDLKPAFRKLGIFLKEMKNNG
jgi:hypothetical protein